MDRMGQSEQAEWLAFDLAMNGQIPKKPRKPPENMTAKERVKWAMENAG